MARVRSKMSRRSSKVARSSRMRKSRVSKATKRMASSRRSMKKMTSRRRSVKKSKRSTRRRSTKRRSTKRRATRATRRASGSKRKLGSYAKFVKSHRAAIKAESRKSGAKFLKVAAQMYKASKPKSMKKSGKKSMKKSVRKFMKKASKVSQAAAKRLATLFSRMPSKMSKVRKSRKSRLSKRSKKAVKSRKSSGRRATGLAMFIKNNKAEVMEYARSHGMTGKRGYVVIAGAKLYKSRM